MLNPVIFDISAENHPDVLARVVMLFHRLATPIQALSMKRPKNSKRMKLRVKIEADAGHADRIAASLLKVVPVISATHSHPKPRYPRKKEQGIPDANQ